MLFRFIQVLSWRKLRVTPHEEILLPIGADQKFVRADDMKAPFLIKRYGPWIFGIDAQPHHRQTIPLEARKRPAHQLVGEATPMMSRGDVELSQFRRRHALDVRVRTRTKHQCVAAYVTCHLGDKQDGIGIFDQRAKAFRRKFLGNVLREIPGIGAGTPAQPKHLSGKS